MGSVPLHGGALLFYLADFVQAGGCIVETAFYNRSAVTSVALAFDAIVQQCCADVRAHGSGGCDEQANHYLSDYSRSYRSV